MPNLYCSCCGLHELGIGGQELVHASPANYETTGLSVDDPLDDQ